MKKLILFIILILPTLVLADSAKVISITPRCAYVANNSVTIPIEVISQNEGTIDHYLDRYLLGSIDNDDIEINLKNNSKTYNIEIDNKDIYFSLPKNTEDMK